MNKKNNSVVDVETRHALSLQSTTPTQLKPYDKYKDSGIAWLGKIPEHWEDPMLKRICQVKRGASPRPIDNPDYFDENGEFAWVRISDVTKSKYFLNTTQQKLSELGNSKSVKIYPGEIFLSIAGSVGKPIISNIKCCIHDGFVYFENLDLNRKYMLFMFLSGQPYKGLGKMGTQLNLNTETVGTIVIPLPSSQEQTAIANFLDYKTAKIDRFIFKKKQLIKLLNEQKAGIINDAVTKGLNPNAKMKPCGIAWLGDIPEAWEVRKLKYVAESVLGKMLCNEDKGGYSKKPYLKSKNIQWLKVDISDVEEMWFSAKELIQYRLNKGDLVLSEGGEVGKTCLWNNEIEECYIQNSAHKLTFNKESNSQFYLYLFYLYGKKGAFESITNKVSIGHLTKDKLINLKCICPPLPEQTAIVSHIEKETAIINKTIVTIEKEIALVQEYRTALIAEAVTGKIDVREYEVPSFEEENEYAEMEDEMGMVAEDGEEYNNQEME